LCAVRQLLKTDDAVLLDEDVHQVEAHVWRVFVEFEEATVVSLR
jgi:hypothetical protein